MATCIKTLIKNRNLVIGCTNHCPYCYARTNCRRYHMTEDFSVPQFDAGKLRLLDDQKPNNYLLTGMSDFADWKPKWNEQIFARIEQNPQNVFLFLTKSPERIRFTTALPNVWMGVTITCEADKGRIAALKKNILCPHYHVSFEPLHGPISGLDLDGINWVVIGTETGKRKSKVDANPNWVWDIVSQASRRNIPIFMKEELAKIVGEDAMIQQLPKEFVQRK